MVLQQADEETDLLETSFWEPEGELGLCLL